LSGPLGLADNGLSSFSIIIVAAASFAAICVSAFVAPRYGLGVAMLFAGVTLFLVERPYTMETSGDGEAIPTRYELIGVILGSIAAIAVVLLRASRAQKAPSS
jgi:hypothetical protein